MIGHCQASFMEDFDRINSDLAKFFGLSFSRIQFFGGGKKSQIFFAKMMIFDVKNDDDIKL